MLLEAEGTVDAGKDTLDSKAVLVSIGPPPGMAGQGSENAAVCLQLYVDDAAERADAATLRAFLPAITVGLMNLDTWHTTMPPQTYFSNWSTAVTRSNPSYLQRIWRFGAGGQSFQTPRPHRRLSTALRTTPTSLPSRATPIESTRPARNVKANRTNRTSKAPNRAADDRVGCHRPSDNTDHDVRISTDHDERQHNILLAPE